MPAPQAIFTTTHWSVVLSARDGDDHAALETLCRDYWRPLYIMARRTGHASHDAEDLVQGFFARLLERSWLNATDPERGRFRTFLSVAFRRHMADAYDHATRQKRGGGITFIPLDVDNAETFLAGDLAGARRLAGRAGGAWRGLGELLREVSVARRRP